MAKKKTIRIINPSTGFDSGDNSTWKKHNDADNTIVNERLKQRREQKRPSYADVRNGIQPLSSFTTPQSFEEYKRMREQEEQDAANKGAADLLAQRYALPGSYGSKEYQEAKTKNIGYKRVGDQAVFVTPNSPLPRLTKENTATKAQVPGAFDIAPEDYLKYMGAIDRQDSIQQPETPDEETTAFLNKYFGGKLPNADEFNARYDELLNDYSVPDEEVRYFYNEGAELVGKATQERERYDQEMSENSAAYEEAIAALGKDAIQHAGGSEADYLGRYGYGYGAQAEGKEFAKGYQTPGWFDNFTEFDAVMASIQNRGSNLGGLATGQKLLANEMNDVQANTFMKLASISEDLAMDYYNSLLRDEGYNQRAWELRDKSMRAKTREGWLGETAKTFLTAPAQIAGTMYSIGQTIRGEEIDPYNLAFLPTQATQTPRDETSQMITENFGTEDDKGNPRDNLWSWLLKAAYGAGTSAIDSRIAGKLSFGMPGLGAAVQGLWASSAGIQDTIARSGSDTQGMLAGIADFITETATEYLPMEDLIRTLEGKDVRTFGALLKNALIQGLHEAPGEGLSGALGYITDGLIMGEMSNWSALVAEKGELGAALSVAGEVLTDAFTGFLSGAAGGAEAGGEALYYNRKVDKLLEKQNNQSKSGDADKSEIQEEGKAEPAPEQPVVQEQPDEQAEAAQLWEQDQLKQETHEERTQAEETHEEHTQPAQAAQQQPSTQEDEQQQGQEKKPANKPKTVKKTMRFKVPVKANQYDEDGNAHSMNVVGVREVNDGRVLLEVETENGSIEVQRAEDVDFDDDGTTTMLLDYGPTERMDAAAVRNYLENYDSTRATEEEYAKVYSAVYARGAAGVDYDTAVEGIGNALTQEAAYLAYAAGENVYNQKNDTVQAAEVVQEPAAEEPKGAKLSAKEPLAKGRLSKRYSQRAFDALGMDGKRRANAQMEILTALASRTKRTIHVVDTIIAEDGTHANASYDPKTGVIRVALDADESAYAYAAAHELTHALKNEHKGEWKAFSDFVTEALETNGKSVDALVQEQMDRHGYNREDAMEEVICNAVPAILQDETNLFKLYKGNRTLFERVMNWVKNLVDDVKRVGEALSKRSPSWKQMDALAKDRKSLQTIYDMMMSVMERGTEDVADTDVVKMSAKESANDQEIAHIKDQLIANRDAVNRLPVVATVWTKGRTGRSDAQLTKEVLESYKASGYEVDRQGFGVVDFGEKAVDKAVHYANSDAEYAAILAAKKVVKRGIEIHSHADHKERRYSSTTFAGPVEVNGKKGIEAVLVKKTKGNRFTVARILAPDGSAFVFENKKDAEPTTGGGRPATEAAAVYTPISPASANSISNTKEKVKYSLRDTDENVQNALTAQQAAFQQIQGGHHITSLEADKIAGEMIKAANSDYDRKQLAAELSRIFHYIETAGEDVDWQQVDDEMTELAARVMARSRTMDLEHEQLAKPVREYLRTHAVGLTKDQKDEAAKISGSYGAYRKALFGRVRLSNTARSTLEHVWRDLHDMAPQWFDADTKAGDMPRALMDAVDAMKTVYHNESGMNVEESAQWLASVMTNAYFQLPAVKAAAKDARTFGDSLIDLHKAWQSFKDTSWSGYQNALEAIRAAKGKQQRTEQQERVAAMRKKYQTWRESDNAQRREREKKVKYRTRIENTTNTLLNWLDKPTDAKHIPADVEGMVRNLLSALDFTGKDTKTAQALSQRLDMLATALQQAQEGEDENRTVFLERDQQMIDEIRHMAQVIGGNQQEGRGVYDLNGLELQELSKWLDVVKHVITEANKMHGGNISVDEAATASIMELDRKKDYKDKTEMQKRLDKNFGPDMQDSFTFFGRLGATANYVFTELRKGFDKSVQLTRKAEEHTKAVLEGLNLKEISGRKAPKQTFELASGEKLELTKGQIMELYVLNRREQARGHLYGDGIILRESEDKIPKKLMQGDVAAITKTLTDAERKAAEMLQRFLSKECAAWGNEASLTLLGYRKFGEEYYWPISTDSNARNTTKLDDTYAADIGAIKNQGMTKQTIEGAKNAIVVGDIFDTYTRHISNMVAYASYAVPLSDFTRWYNSRGVKTQIEQKLGKGALNYINEFLMAINGSSRQAKASGIAGTIKWMNRNAKAASVGLNLRVVVQQPTSFARAAMYMSPKYLSKALGMKSPSMDLVNKYCGIAQWKSWGFYETNIGPNLRAMLTGDQTAVENLREKSMWAAAKGDEWTLKHLWNACEAETRELWPELQPGSEEFYQQVGNRMSEIVDRTQVVDSVFHRSQMMRSKNELNQILTNFMSEPTKTYNMLMSAYYQYAENRKDKAARARLGRALLTYAVSGVLTAAAAAVVDAFRDEDAEKEWIEKYLSALGGNTIDNLNPLGMLPGVKDVVSLLQGYEASRLDQQSLQKLIWAGQELYKYGAHLFNSENPESNLSWQGVVYKLSQAFSSISGIPVNNVFRDLNAIWQTATGTDLTKTAKAQKNSTISQLYKATTEGKIQRANDLRTRLQKQAGMTPKEIDTKLAEELKEHTKVQEAYEAKKAGRIADANRARNALTAMGFGGETVDKAISRYASSVETKEEKPKDPNEQLSVKLFTSKDAASTIRMACGLEKGGATLADAKAVISELIADSTAKDAAKTTKSNIQSELKADYVKLIQTGKTAQAKQLAQMMQELLGTTQKTLDKWIKDAKTK